MSINEAVERWEKMESRERDLWVAENVMGYMWRDVRLRGETNTVRVLHDRPDCPNGMTYPPDGMYDHLDLTSWTERYTPDFSQSAGADYKVLEKVRETWDSASRSNFANMMFLVWDSRGGGIPAMEYRPGDYSLAAYIVLESKGVGV